jgi:alpha-beta hydrolase superfamily lysophospholipase
VRRTPVLQIENGADDAVPATHNPAIRAALATPDKAFVSIPGATHYYLGQPDHLATCIAAVTDWSWRKGLLEG